MPRCRQQGAAYSMEKRRREQWLRISTQAIDELEDLEEWFFSKSCKGAEFAGGAHCR